MRPNVDEVDLYSTRELAPAAPLVPDINWLVPLCNPATGISYKADQELIGSIISSYIGSGIVIPDRVYRIGVEMPAGSSVSVVAGKGVLTDPYLDGKVFSINRRGVELMMKGVEWDNDVVGGGARLLQDGDIFGDGEIIIAQFQPQISPVISTPDAIARFTAGVQLLSGNTNLTASSYRKLLVIISPGIMTLGSAFPENVICAFTQNTVGDGQSTITAPPGQSIAYNGVAVSSVWLGKNERIGLIRAGNTWYVAYEQTGYDKIGTIVAGRLKGANQIIAQGQTVLRADYPRLLDYLNRLNAAYPGAVVNAATWPANKTLWGFGNNTTTIQVPDLRGYFPRWLDLGAGIDIDRGTSNIDDLPGSKQADAFKAHDHDFEAIFSNDNLGGSGYVASSNGPGGSPPTYVSLNTRISTEGGTETRGINAAELPLINV